MTLPLIRALAVGTPDEAALIRARDHRRPAHRFRSPCSRCSRAPARSSYARACAQRESDAAAACVAGLPASPHRENLLELASFAARRTY